MWPAARTELAGWVAALTNRQVLFGLLGRLGLVVVLVSVGLLGADQPEQTLAVTLGCALVLLLVWIRLVKRL